MKIVGKLLALLLLACTSTGYAEVTLQALDVHGAHLKEAYAGVPFRLEIVTSGLGNNIGDPIIAGLESAHAFVQGRRSKVQIINGQISASYSFEVRIDEPGTYVLGPAQLKDAENNVVQSNSLNLVVAKSDTRAPDARQEQQSNAFIRVSADKKRVVPGERVRVSVRFYFSSPDVELQQIVVPELKGFKVLDRGKPRVAKEKINGMPHNYVEWLFDFYPTEVGAKVIPAYCANYRVMRQEDERDQASLFANFFSRRSYAQKRVYSNTVSLAIEELPQHTGPVCAIGSMRGFHAQVKPLAAKEGEGIVVMLTLDGDIDWDAVEAPGLQNLPDTFKHYDSKSYCVDAGSGKKSQKKCFEYIMQGMQAGTWEFPKQQFTYFDVNSRTYKTLETIAQPITILAQAHAGSQGSSYESYNKPVNPEVAQAVDVPMDIIAPILKDGIWYAQKSREISAGLFVLLVLIPLILVGGGFMRGRIRAYRLKNTPHAKKKYAFKHAHERLDAAKKNRDYSQLHPIFVEFFASYLVKPQSEISQDVIEQVMRDSSTYTDEQFDAWNKFFTHIAALVFSPKDSHAGSDDLFAQAHEWLDSFQESL